MKSTTISRYIFWSIVTFLLYAPFAFAQGLQNPLQNIKTLPEFIERLLLAVIYIGTPIAVLFIIYSGFLFVLAQGNQDKLKEAKNTFMYTIIGVAIFLGAWTIAKLVASTIMSITG